MAAEWFYTTKKQQMGPVSWMELRELVESGILKPHDMVWTEGMDEWVKAINQAGLFADDAGASVGRKKASYAETKPPPGRRKRRRDEEEDDEEDEEDEREEKRKARRRSEERAKMGVGLKVGLILGGGFLLLMFLGCGIGGLVWLSMRDGGEAGPGQHNFTVRNLPQGGSQERQFRFQQGRRVVITVNNTTQFPHTDVDLHLLRGINGNDIVALDERLPMQDRNCRLDINIQATDTYRVRIVNLGPGMANSCVVNVTVQ